MQSIQELDTIDWFDELSAQYQAQNGAEPFNISHWDPSAETIRSMNESLRLPLAPLVFPYVYSYELRVQPQILERLGFAPDNHNCLVLANGTTAITFAAAWLKSLDVERVLILCPSYFPVFYVCDLMGLAWKRVHMLRSNGRWRLPADEIASLADRQTAVWVTNPVYCAGVYLSNDDRNVIATLLDNGVPVVLDECLALNGQELAPQLSVTSPYLVGLYSPHKAVCMNAVKFSAVVFNHQHDKFFSHWADVLSGGLGVSSYVAVNHFIDRTFLDFQNAFLELVKTSKTHVMPIVLGGRGLEVDQDSSGYFMTCYVPGLEALPPSRFFRDFLFSTGTLVIPGARNHFPLEVGFSFRVNLARASRQFSASLHRVVFYLSEIQRSAAAHQ